MENIETQVQYWKMASKRDWETAQYLFDGKRYDAGLFFVHLSMEKILKGLVVQHTSEPAPFTHNLLQLARYAKLDLSEENMELLQIITSFNIAGRYDTQKREFFKKCTASYSKRHLDESQVLRLWLVKQFQKR